MKTLKFTFFMLFVNTTSIMFSQITKGTKSIGSSFVNFSVSSNQSQSSGSSSIFKSNSLGGGFGVGGFNYFVTNRLQVGGGLSFNYNIFKNTQEQSGTSVFSSNGNNLSVNVTPEIRYFFYQKANNYYFLNLNSSLALRSIKNEGVFNPNQTSSDDKTELGVSTGLGYLRPINENLAWMGSLNYNYRNGNSNYMSLNIGLQNFFQFFNKKDEVPPQFLTKGLSLYSGSFNTYYYFDSSNQTSLGIYYSQLKLVKDRVAVGGFGGIYTSFAKGRDDYASLSAGILARYYIPLTNRWFIYPEVGYRLDASSFGKSKSFNGSIIRNVGVEYFLTKNLAFNVNANLSFNYNKNVSPSTNINGSEAINRGFSTYLNFGFSYYADKIFKK